MYVFFFPHSAYSDGVWVLSKMVVENKFRENFNLTGVPIVLVFRDK